MDGDLDDLFGRSGGNLLDFNTAFTTCHQDDAATGAVKNCTEINFTFNVCGFVHKNFLDGKPLDVHAKNGRRSFFGFVGSFGKLDTACFAATTDEDLTLDDYGATETNGNVTRFGGCGRNLTFGNGDAILGKYTFGLVFM